ncbi:MAG: hypothetical protein IT330_12540 [Anaerolineae bacterium]|nr:hypothetical protein [Anaerolineae bacterium]
MKKAALIFSLVVVLAGLAACGGGSKGGGGQSLDYEAVTRQFSEALLTGKYDDAKALALKDEKEKVSQLVDKFAPILDKYQVREIKTASFRAWGVSASQEADKRAEVNFQFAEKGTEDWKIGQMQLRVVAVSGLWGISDVILLRPDS